ncbi:hypothetical protein EZS27_023417 [termite gut metagenome]|uniref:Uncharacterized protein n=1 Tax=termite gut metagenome TaxID=433724 RepID=A0A5J4R1X2_9ZZZZ
MYNLKNKHNIVYSNSYIEFTLFKMRLPCLISLRKKKRHYSRKTKKEKYQKYV